METIAMAKDQADRETIELPFVRNPHNYNRDKASNESGLKCLDATRTEQHLKDETDINEIVRRFNLTGQLPTNIRMPQSGDFRNLPDFQSAMNAIVAARESFDAMPANVRARFHNDPAEFVAFCDDPDNLEEARKLGLAPPKPAGTPDPKEPAPAGAGSKDTTQKGGVT